MHLVQKGQTDHHPLSPDAIVHCSPHDGTLLHFGGPDGELGASLRYLSQRYAMPYPRVQGLLTDIGTVGSFCVPSRFLPAKNHPCVILPTG